MWEERVEYGEFWNVRSASRSQKDRSKLVEEGGTGVLFNHRHGAPVGRLEVEHLRK